MRPATRAEAEERILTAIRRHFREELGRPELLNRLGDNIVVFDFINRDAGERIFDTLLANVARRVHREYKCGLELAPEARAILLGMALENLDHGGRGIGSVLENALVNPLARALFQAPPETEELIRVAAVHRRGRRFHLELA